MQGDLPRLLEQAAVALQQQQQDAQIQRGIAIASQTLANELALKCERLQDSEPSMAAEQQQHLLMAAAAATPANNSWRHHSLPAERLVPPSSQPPPNLPAASLAASGGGVDPLSAATVGAQCARVEAGANPMHGGQPKTWAQGEQQSAEPWGGNSADRRPANATINASLSNSTGLRNEPSAVVDAEAEASVDAKVFDLKQRFKQSGVTLPLEKQSGAVYRLGSRKLQLSIRNSRLTVRVGSSNFIDFLEYLSKAAI